MQLFFKYQRLEKQCDLLKIELSGGQHSYFPKEFVQFQLTLMVRSADPVQNHWLPGSTAQHLTQPV